MPESRETMTIRVQCVRSDNWIQCVAPGVSLMYQPYDLERLDFLPRVGQSFDLTLEITGSTDRWLDGRFKLTTAIPVGVANVGEASER